ncbi:MAG: nuclear transport factor 2 family protein [Candidatus Cyclobacteriaceae bacterium M3_2C_046]
MEEKPFYRESLQLFEAVSQHDFTTLASLCDDDFGIVDLNEEGKNVVIRDRKGWEQWFTNLFAKLKQMKAETWTEITNYEALKGTDMGYSVVDFDQLLKLEQDTLRFSCITTIIWKKTEQGWKESRYHSSLIKVAKD